MENRDRPKASENRSSGNTDGQAEGIGEQVFRKHGRTGQQGTEITRQAPSGARFPPLGGNSPEKGKIPPVPEPAEPFSDFAIPKEKKSGKMPTACGRHWLFFYSSQKRWLVNEIDPIFKSCIVVQWRNRKGNIVFFAKFFQEAPCFYFMQTISVFAKIFKEFGSAFIDRTTAKQK